MRRSIFLLYGIISYALFLFSFLYAVGFVMNILAPTTLDGEVLGSFQDSLLVDLGLLGVFAIQHSVMARKGFKKWWTKIIPVPIERSTYVLLSSICLLALVYYWRPLGGIIWTIENPIWANVLLFTGVAGWFMVLISTFLINHFDLFGLRQVWMYFQKKEYTHLMFRLNSLYKYIRHPLYMGFLIAFWFTPVMSISHLVFSVMCTGYILVGIKLEEKDMISTFGKGYEDYKLKTPMLIPMKPKLKETEVKEIITAINN